MKWYFFIKQCPRCSKRVYITDLQYSADGEIKVLTRCADCNAGFENTLKEGELKDEAYRRDNPFPTPKDLDFLRDLKIIWTQKELPPP